jgi:hypothetical protein
MTMVTRQYVKQRVEFRGFLWLVKPGTTTPRIRAFPSLFPEHSVNV